MHIYFEAIIFCPNRDVIYISFGTDLTHIQESCKALKLKILEFSAVLQSSCEIPDNFTSPKYVSVMLNLVITSRFHVCCETPLLYK